MLPVIRRELLVRARNRGTYWGRFVVVLVGTCICLPQVFSSYFGGDPARMGQGIFTALVVVSFLLSCGACLVTVDAISAERRQGTLGLLFLSRINAFEIVLGKLGSAGLSAVCGLVAFLPVMMIPVLTGGVTAGEACRMEMALLGLLFLALAVDIRVSASAWESMPAARNGLLIMGGVILLPSMLEVIVIGGSSGTGSGVGLISPLFTTYYAGDAVYKASPSHYWVSLLLVLGMSVALVVSAGMKLRKTLLEAAERTMAIAVRAGDVPLRSRVKMNDPIEWLVLRQRGLRGGIWLAGIILVVHSLFSLTLGSIGRFGVPFWAYVPWVFNLVVSATTDALLARAASRFFHDAGRSGQLELLLTTPHGTQSVLAGQARALRRLLRWPIGIVLAVGLFVLFVALTLDNWVRPAGYLLPVIMLLGLAETVLTVMVLCWLGMWFGLRGYSPLATMLRAAGLATGVPLLFRMVAGFGFSLVVWRMFGYSTPWIYASSLGQQLLVIGYYWWLIRRTRRQTRNAISDRVWSRPL